MALSATYASPGLRWGLLLEDHPAATYEFTTALAEDFGVPQDFGGDAMVCVATIKRPGLPDVVAWKAPGPEGTGHGKDQRTPDGWNILQTKTLGRALKRAGYPDDMPSLKALVLWRQRNAEVAAITGGAAPHLQLGPGAGPEDNDALDAAAVVSLDEPSPDDGHLDAALVDAEVVE
jgi:hypothetical protein